MFVFSTASGNAGSCTIAPSFWSDEYAVIAESGNGNVQVVKLAGMKTGEHGVEYTSAETVARLKVNDGGCCGSAVWYS